MSLSTRSKQHLANAMCSNQIADEIAALAGAEGTDPSMTTIVTSGDATVGGDVKIASGHVLKVAGTQVVGAQQTAAPALGITFTTGGTPSLYTSPSATATIADSTSPTVAELLAYCNNLRGRIKLINDILHAHGLTT